MRSHWSRQRSHLPSITPVGERRDSFSNQFSTLASSDIGGRVGRTKQLTAEAAPAGKPGEQAGTRFRAPRSEEVGEGNTGREDAAPADTAQVASRTPR